VTACCFVACGDVKVKDGPHLSLRKQVAVWSRQAMGAPGQPAVQLVVHNNTDLSDFFGERARSSKHRQEQEICLRKVESLYGNRVANDLRHKQIQAPDVSVQA
jgi:hypothetical protein